MEQFYIKCHACIVVEGHFRSSTRIHLVRSFRAIIITGCSFRFRVTWGSKIQPLMEDPQSKSVSAPRDGQLPLAKPVQFT